MQLNQQQKAVVNKISGPCLVIAGAGSGKTRVIIQKILHLIATGYQPKSIYAITFTNKAASEMKERLINSDPTNKDLKLVNVSTFHTLGLAIIRSHAQSLKLKSKVILYDSHDQRVLLNDIISKYPLDLEIGEEVKNSLKYISACKTRLIHPHTHDANVFSEEEFPNGEKYWKIYCEYVSYMLSISAIDFDDLLLLPCLLFTQDEQALNNWRSKVGYLLVDEYQDTNLNQLAMIRHLMDGKSHFTMVGDDDQAIYSWRGADSRNLQILGDYFPQLEVFKLEQNYRSTQLILDCANQLISNNSHLYEKRLYSQNPIGEKVAVYQVTNQRLEADYIVSDICGRIASSRGKLNYSDVAILYRSNYQSREVEQSLTKMDLPYLINGDSSFYELPEIRDVISYLKILVNPDDDRSLLRVINRPAREIGTRTIEQLGMLAKHYDSSIHDACWHPDLIEYIGASSYNNLMQFINQVDRVTQEIHYSQDSSLIEQFIEEIGYYHYLESQSTKKGQSEQQIKNVKQLLSWITGWMNPDQEYPLNLTEVVNRIFLRELFINKGREDGHQAIQLMTMHSSKGLEFKLVYIIGVETEIIPHANSTTPEEIEEERRIFYVSITRAKEQLVITHASTRKQQGTEIKVDPSPFLDELPQDLLQYHDRTKEAKVASYKSFMKEIGIDIDD